MLRILFCGGGSIGHLAPSIAIWEMIQKKHGNCAALFACSGKKSDRQFLTMNDVRSSAIHAPKTGGILSLIIFPLLFPIALLESLCVLLNFKPRVIFAKGGYVTVPVCLIGWILRIPIVLHESDRTMGRANRFLLKFCTHLCIGTPQKELSNGDVMTQLKIPVTATGNPVRQMMKKGTVDGGRRITNFSGKRPVLLIIGGSQGAKALNQAVWNNFDALLDTCDVVHITGPKKMNPKKTHARYLQAELMSEEIHHLYALADIVLSRASAGVLAELALFTPALILTPLPSDLANNHQAENAKFLHAAGAALIIEQGSLDTVIAATIKDLAEHEEKRSKLSDAFKAIADPDAAERVANILIDCAT